MDDFKYRPNNFPPITKNLVIINVLVFVAQLALEAQFQLTEKIMLYPIMPQQLHDILVSSGNLEAHQKFEPYQIATHMFAHAPNMFFSYFISLF